MIHAVIDTNVLVSALLTSKSDAATVKVLKTPLVVTPAEMIDIFRRDV